MKFNTCACHKDSQSMKCVYTGMIFVCVDREATFTGDMFFCKHCKALSIHGIPESVLTPGRFEPAAIFCGLYYRESKTYIATDSGGTIDLAQKGIDYLQKYDSYVFQHQIEDDDVS